VAPAAPEPAPEANDAPEAGADTEQGES
jgi:hypothetical protein